MTFRDAGFLRSLPEDDDLYLTIDGNRAVIRGNDIPRILTGTERPIFNTRQRVGTIRGQNRPGYNDIVLIHLKGNRYQIWKDKFEAVWNQQLKWAKVVERQQEVIC